MADNVFDYDNVFSLILSLTEQISKDKDSGYTSSETLDSYFSRLTKRTLGEYEFARRMAFEHINVVRLAPYPILRKVFKQPITMDFIMNFEGKTVCVDVKNYGCEKLQETFIVKKHILEQLEEFKTKFGLGGAYLGIKRFETWYLINIDKIKKGIPLVGELYNIPIQKLQEYTDLKENRFAINIGKKSIATSPFENPTEGSEYGLFVKSITIKTDSVSFQMSKKNASGKNDDTYLEGIQAEIMNAIITTIEKNIKFLINSQLHPSKMSEIKDLLPTLFSIFDKIHIDSKEKLLSSLKPLIDAEYIIQDKPYLPYHLGGYWSIRYSEMREQ